MTLDELIRRLTAIRADYEPRGGEMRVVLAGGPFGLASLLDEGSDGVLPVYYPEDRTLGCAVEITASNRANAVCLWPVTP